MIEGRRVDRREPVTIRDVARLADVSISTVSRALSRATKVSGPLEARVVQAAEKLNYRPNAAARGLRQARTRTFGVIFNDLGIQSQIDFYKGLGDFSREQGYSLVIGDAQGDHVEYRALIGRFYEQRVEGLFLVAPYELGDSLSDFRRLGVPIVSVQYKDASASETPLVAQSDRRAIRTAMYRLTEFGHREIAYFLGSWAGRQIRNIETALRDNGIMASRHSYQLGRSEEGSVCRDRIRRALSASDRPTALITSTQYVALACSLATAAGLRVPTDLSVISYGDSPSHVLFAPEIASIRIDDRSLGCLAAEVMVGWLSGEEPRPVYTELAEWVERLSVGPAPSQD